MPPLYLAAADKADTLIEKLVSQEITWAEYRLRSVEIRRQLNARLAEAKVRLNLSSLRLQEPP